MVLGRGVGDGSKQSHAASKSAETHGLGGAMGVLLEWKHQNGGVGEPGP